MEKERLGQNVDITRESVRRLVAVATREKHRPLSPPDPPPPKAILKTAHFRSWYEKLAEAEVPETKRNTRPVKLVDAAGGMLYAD